MYSRDNDSRENRYNGRPQYNRSSNRPAPLPEGFALYYIAALCPGDVNEQVSRFKLYMQEKYGSRAAQKSPAHLTIVPPFKAEEDMEKLLKDFVEAYNVGLVPFEVQLKNFDHFEGRVLFVDVVPNEALNAMEQDVNTQFTSEFPSIIFRTKPEFHPHVTIATRDIPEHKFNEIWQYFQQQQLDAVYPCKELTVMKLDRGVWQQL
ncbi:MAG: 2'-5' RNA ligase family protein [Bacteroidota bacterium]